MHPVKASPRARRAMKQLGIDSGRVRGSGPGGRIIESDVIRASADKSPVTAHKLRSSPRARRAMRRLALQPGEIRGSGPDGRILEADVLLAASRPPQVTTAAPAECGGHRPPLQVAASRMRAAIARRTGESFRDTPHFYLSAECDASDLVTTRNQLADQVEKDHGVRITYTDFLLAAQAHALADCPFANVIWQDGGLLQLTAIDVGLVVGLPDGLLIPLLRNADQLSLIGIARERQRLIEAARRGQIETGSPGAGSLSNLGRGRVDEFAAIINPPQSSMLAAGRIATRPWVRNDALVACPTIKLTLSADHRVMDGEPAARFLERIVQYVESPVTLLMKGLAG